MNGLDLYWTKGWDEIYYKEYDESFVPTRSGERYEICEVGEDSGNGYVNLDKDKEYLLGMDMSLSQSGIVILDMKLNLVCMIDIFNKGMPEEIFYEHLRSFFKSNLSGLKFRHAVVEEQIEAKGGKKTFTTLSKLQGIVFSFSTILGTKVENIKPNVWRKHFLKSREYEGRRQNKIDVKISCGEEVVKRYESTYKYIELMKPFSKSDQGRICDSCDAVGVILGFMEENYVDSEFQMRQVSKTMPIEYNHKIDKEVYRYNVSTDTIFVKNLIGEGYTGYAVDTLYASHIKLRGKRWIFYNNSMKLDENVRRCTSNFKEVILIPVSDSKANVALEWSTGNKLEQGEIFLIVAMKSTLK